ncbi:hypothetical protein EDD21DRAFT_373924 [Dissophora ornata]|nr:hypothetical protein EDD21DRAFT_373924 [Dissophora ornata]
MGQYYTLINISKRQLLPTFTFEGNQIVFDQFTTGAKMVEQLYDLGNKPFLAMGLTELNSAGSANPIAPIGNWSGDRIVLIGDYCDDLPPFLTVAECNELQAAGSKNLSSFANKHYSPLAKRDFLKDNVGQEFDRLFPRDSETYHLVLNLDKKEFLDPRKFHESTTFVNEFALKADGIMQSLYALIFYSTGSGGGDVQEFKQGRWAGNHITIREKERVSDLESWDDISEHMAETLNDVMERE